MTRSAPSKALLVLASILFTFLATLAIDRCLGFFLPGNERLLFPPKSVAVYSTAEFNIKATINNLGFRGRDFPGGSRKRRTIMTLGDSFTFGWGVADQETWSAVLEERLRAGGLDVEVVNLGQPGTYPAYYAEIAERAVPVLKPDLVIVAVNQGDDVSQTMSVLQEARQPGYASRLLSLVKTALTSAYPSLVGLRRAMSSGARISATAGWKTEVAKLVSELTAEERAKFERMDDEIRTMFRDGGLNPPLLASVLRDPEFISKTLVVDNPLVQKAQAEVARQLRRVRTAAESAGGSVVVISLPNGFFVSREMLDSYARMGFIVDQSYLKTEVMDEMVCRAAADIGVKYHGVTENFRRESRQRKLFYKYDGHYNAEGQRLFAESIEAFVAQAVRDPASVRRQR
jgi:lysophospholipase L1-like esterase